VNDKKLCYVCKKHEGKYVVFRHRPDLKHCEACYADFCKKLRERAGQCDLSREIEQCFLLGALGW